MKNTTVVLILIAFTLVGITVFTEEAKTEPTIITKPIFYPDPLLEHDFTSMVHDIPPVYTSKGKINPFLVILAAEPKKVKRQELVKVVPTTPLTKWAVGQLKLTSIVVNHVFAYAYFTTPESAKVYRGEVGNYVGKSGGIIAGIEPGMVNLTDGTSISINR